MAGVLSDLAYRGGPSVPGVLGTTPPFAGKGVLALGSGLNMNLLPEGGIAPYGLRHSGLAPKGLGFFGPLNNKQGGASTELSAEGDYNGKPIEFPLMVPTLTKTELQALLSGRRPSDAIYNKAQDYAIGRMSRGLNPFIGPGELRYPVPR